MDKYTVENNYIRENLVSEVLLKNISEKYNIGYEELLIKLNQIKSIKTINTKYSSDHLFFSKENEKSFYLAGFIAADGCVFKKDNSKILNIFLAEKDLYFLQKIKEYLNYNGPIYKKQDRKFNENCNYSVIYGFTLASHQIFDDLNKFGIIPNKTKVFKMPEWLLNHSLVNHFIRGYFDGDGSIYLYKNKNNEPVKPSLDMVGNLYFLNQIKDIFNKHANINSETKPRLNNGSYNIKFCGSIMVDEIKNYLYKDATIFMERKKVLFDICPPKRERYISR